MNYFKYVLGSGFASVMMVMFSGIHFTSCTKEQIHDTTTIVIHDTIIKERIDTLIQIDTVCHLELGLVAHYNFTGGSLEDETDYNNDIIFNNANLTTDRAGVANNAYLFDGNSSYMRVANSSSLNPEKITLMARIRVDDFYMGTCHFSELIGKGATDITNGFYVLRIADPYGHCYEAPDVTKEFFVGGFGDNIPEGAAAGVMADTSFIQKNGWYTVVYTYDGNESKIYVNGDLKNVTQKNVTSSGNDRDVFIGRHEDPNFPYWFNGVIDEIRIYNRAINCNEVDQLCASNAGKED